MPPRIKRFEIKGFKSIQAAGLEPGAVNVLIGQNGAGKSNLIAFFRMLSWMVKSVDRFQDHVADLGWASSILFDGPNVTREIEGLVEIETERGLNEYAFRLARSGQDQLFFAEEKVRFTDLNVGPRNPNWIDLGFGHANSKLFESSSQNTTVKVIASLLKGIFVYQFHNTTPRSAIRGSWQVRDGRFLHETGANLGSFLLNLERNHSPHYAQLIRHLRGVLPFFDRFELGEEREGVLLQWREKNSEQLFFAGQASDGMLRIIATWALLCQPAEMMPAVLFIDEPELGLHPAAIDLLAALVRKASQHCQIFLSTQSPALVSAFEPEDVIVVERPDRASVFTRLERGRLEPWLEAFSLGQIWEKNVIGGRP